MVLHLRAAFVMFALLSLVTGVAYPVLVTLLAQALFPHQANGSLLERKGVVVGSHWIGQAFDEPRYFWGRPSATAPVPYNGTASGGSNFGPNHADHLHAVAKRVEALRNSHPGRSGPVPVDLVTSSASGLDPHISPAAAEYQAERVAQARHLASHRVHELIARSMEKRFLGILGEPRVNVLRLNLSLDEMPLVDSVP